MKFKNNKVIFIPKSKDIEICVPRPKPSKLYIPQWFKEMPSYIPKANQIGKDATAKKCIPFLDGLTSGYTQELACDIEIEVLESSGENSVIKYGWSGYQVSDEIKPLSTRQEDVGSSNSMPHFFGYHKQEFHWNTFWEPKTPPGYSTLYFHPSNRFDLPFMTHSAIIDTDKWPMTGPIPFVIKKGFSGIIPAGTPIYQMIFIKRDTWNSEQAMYDEEYDKKTSFSVRKFFKDGYKKQIWSKKEYN
jgi:hypothetical protein